MDTNVWDEPENDPRGDSPNIPLESSRPHDERDNPELPFVDYMGRMTQEQTDKIAEYFSNTTTD